MEDCCIFSNFPRSSGLCLQPHRGMPHRNLKTHMIFRLLVPSLLSIFATVAVHAEEFSFKDTVTRSGAFRANGEITLENVNGSVEINTWDRNEIQIDVEKSAKTEEELNLIDLSIDLSDSRAAIKVRLPKRSGGFFSGNGNIRAAVKFKLNVPATVTLSKIATVNSSITLSGVRGAVNASSVNGGVRAEGLAGPLKLETVNGAIRATVSTVSAGQRLSFKTVNGQVRVALPSDAGFQLHSSVVNGRVTCDFPLDGRSSKAAKTLAGKVGDGRASLEAETVNGSVQIESL